MRVRPATALALAAWLVASTAQGQSASSDSLLREGVELRRQGRDADALATFARAYAVDHSPIALAQMGLAEQALGSWVASEAHVRGALAVHGNPWIEANRAAIEQAYTTISQHVGTIELDGVRDGAEIFVNGTSVGRTPLAEPIHVAAGDVTLEVRAAGYRTVSRPVTVTGGTATYTSIALEPDPHRHGSFFRPLAFAAAGGAAAGLVVGLVGIAVRENAVASYNADPFCPGLDAGFQPLTCQDRIARGDAMRTMQIVGFASTAVFAVASVTLWFLGSRNTESRASRVTHRIAWTCGAGPGAVGIACTIGY